MIDFFNISIQKAGIPGFSSCIEHASMLLDQIKAAWNNKSAELHVIWLDLENVYGSRKQWISFRFQKTLESLY